MVSGRKRTRKGRKKREGREGGGGEEREGGSRRDGGGGEGGGLPLNLHKQQLPKAKFALDNLLAGVLDNESDYDAALGRQ